MHLVLLANANSIHPGVPRSTHDIAKILKVGDLIRRQADLRNHPNIDHHCTPQGTCSSNTVKRVGVQESAPCTQDAHERMMQWNYPPLHGEGYVCRSAHRQPWLLPRPAAAHRRSCRAPHARPRHQAALAPPSHPPPQPSSVPAHMHARVICLPSDHIATPDSIPTGSLTLHSTGALSPVASHQERCSCSRDCQGVGKVAFRPRPRGASPLPQGPPGPCAAPATP